MNQKAIATPAERAKRRRYLSAMAITCVVLLMVGGTMHVVKLGASRMEDMRNLASYDLKEENKRVRAAGEDIMLHYEHEGGLKPIAGYTAQEAEALLSPSDWADVATMVAIPAGQTVMGTNSERADAQNHPQHTVSVKAYKIDKYPVTNAQYAKFVAATGHRPPLNWENGKIPQAKATYPVTMVDWYDAAAYAKWAGKRLPTEAEYERAGRGNDGRLWPWGNNMDPERLNTYYNVGATTNVHAYPKGASEYGVMDLSGNVSEWVADDFLPYPGTDAPADLFQGKIGRTSSSTDKAMKVVDLMPVETHYKVMRGGSWKSDPFSTALYHRNFSLPIYASDFFGFRCAQDVTEPAKGR